MWQQTFNGSTWSMDDMTFDIEDIAHSLSLQVRYNGHTTVGISIAEHCVHIHDWLEWKEYGKRTCRAGLLHDALEAYLGDIVMPIKQRFPAIIEAENIVGAEIAHRFDFDWPVPEIVDLCDKLILVNEKKFFKDDLVWPGLEEAGQGLPGVEVVGWDAWQAKARFLNAFERCKA